MRLNKIMFIKCLKSKEYSVNGKNDGHLFQWSLANACKSPTVCWVLGIEDTTEYNKTSTLSALTFFA